MSRFYWHMIKNKGHIPTCISKWHATYGKLRINIDEIWKRIVSLPFNGCRETKHQSFQYKLIHSHYLYNLVKNIRIENTTICQYCNEDINNL